MERCGAKVLNIRSWRCSGQKLNVRFAALHLHRGLHTNRTCGGDKPLI